MSPEPLHKIAILGAGLAGSLCAAALSARLPNDIELILVDVPGADATDVFFGTVTSPTAYNFLLGIGITEPDLFPHTNTAFSLGTHFENWGPAKRSWTQSFHRPLPNFEGVEFQHYLTRMRKVAPQLASLQPYLMSVHAARRGVFAHPPQGQKTPLADLEYGYQFLPATWQDLFFKKANANAVTQFEGSIETIERDKRGHITSIQLSDSATLKADLFIDCLGQNSPLTTVFEGPAINAAEQFVPSEQLGPACRKLSGTSYGWQAETPLQDGMHRLKVIKSEYESRVSEEPSARGNEAVSAIIGYCSTPWTGNLLTLGHGAALLEPLSPAPIMNLQRDIDRLTELIPVTSDMRVEAREYNRRFSADYEHAAIFHQALFEAEFSDAMMNEKLTNKTTQFKSRGVTVQYDLEPFLPIDWIQLHSGMGRQPERYDPLADRIDEQKLVKTLRQMRGANEMMASKMPPHHVYMAGLLKYLRKQNGG